MHDEQDMRKMGALRKFMPITAATFIVGWLAIAGVPPFSGFWSKDEILLFALAESPVLYDRDPHGDPHGVLHDPPGHHGVLRRGALDEPRQRRGGPRGRRGRTTPVETHNAHGEFKPHESPPIMWIPLVALAGVAALGGIDQRAQAVRDPRGRLHKLEDWLHPVIEFGEADITGTWAYDNKYVLVAIAVACALIGIVARLAGVRAQADQAVGAGAVRNGWYYDEAISWFMGNPGRGASRRADFDAKVVDGASTVSRRRSRRPPSRGSQGPDRLRAPVRGVIGIGVVLLLGGSW
jgi:NADH-quinone oxidoreductase subunit L